MAVIVGIVNRDAPDDPGVVHQNRNRAQPLLHLSREGNAGIGIGHIHDLRMGRAAGGLDLSSHAGRAFAIDIAQRDTRAMAGKAQGNCPAVTLRGPRHHRDVAGQKFVHAPPLSFRILRTVSLSFRLIIVPNARFSPLRHAAGDNTRNLSGAEAL